MGPHITYEELKEIVLWGIFNRNVKGIGCDTKDLELYSIIGAVHGGIYIGSPGKDIYLMLPYLDKEQMKETALILGKKFLKKPPTNHVNIAACIRFIYGQFDKQGILKSKKDFERMKKENLNWELPRKFLNLLYKRLEKDNNYYGLSILCEMEGHRLGDEAIINKDKEKLKRMEETYNKSVEFAHKCKSWKQLFTPYYWSAMYLIKFRDREKSIRYCKLTIENAEKYCPDSRASYIEKLIHCLEYLKENDKNEWKEFYRGYKKMTINRCVKKAIKRIKE